MARHEKESPLSRWSRLKREAREVDDIDAARKGGSTQSGELTRNSSVSRNGDSLASEGPAGAGPLPELPPLESLGPDSDFTVFMDPRVDEDMRSAALRTLFRAPDFNLTDGLDVYAEDYTKLEKLTPAFVAGLKYAQRTLFAENDNARDTAVVADPSAPASVDAELPETDTQVRDEGTSDGEAPDNPSAETPDVEVPTTGPNAANH